MLQTLGATATYNAAKRTTGAQVPFQAWVKQTRQRKGAPGDMVQVAVPALAVHRCVIADDFALPEPASAALPTVLLVEPHMRQTCALPLNWDLYSVSDRIFAILIGHPYAPNRGINVFTGLLSTDHSLHVRRLVVSVSLIRDSITQAFSPPFWNTLPSLITVISSLSTVLFHFI